MSGPKLRSVDKVKPPFPLNKFPPDFIYILGEEIIYLLATKGRPTLEGDEWEQIFARCVGAKWKPSNVGLDDVVLSTCAWGAKTVKGKPSKAKHVRLISGRNSPSYSFGQNKIGDVDPSMIGKMVLDIWNERVWAIKQGYKHLRTVVLIKSDDLSEVGVFEFDTVAYVADNYHWSWNKNNNLEGHSKATNEKVFTWQPHGSQFTITEKVPDDCYIIQLKKPETVNKELILKGVGFDKSWVTLIKKV